MEAGYLGLGGIAYILFVELPLPQLRDFMVVQLVAVRFVGCCHWCCW